MRAPPGSFYVVRWFDKWRPPVWRPLSAGFLVPRVFRSEADAERVAREVHADVGGVVGVLGPVDDVQVACDLLPAPVGPLVDGFNGKRIAWPVEEGSEA